MSNGPIVVPDAPKSWTELADRVIIIMTLAASMTATIIGGCNATKINTVQQTQAGNEAKLDTAAKAATDAKTHAAKLETKLETIEKKTDVIKSAVDRP